MLTHFDDPECNAAYTRLAHEAGRFGTVIRVRHARGDRRAGVAPSLRLSDSDIRRSLPARFAQAERFGRAINAGYVDTLFMAAIRRLPGFHRYWFIEFDVDFSGSWDAFFSQFENSRADLLGAALQRRAACEDWVHWPWFQCPANADPNRALRGFFPVVRISRRLAEAYAAEAGRWSGHFEAVLPSLALYAGLSVEDIGGRGPLVLPGRRGRNYSFREVRDPRFGTYRAYPPVAGKYFPLCGQRLPRNHLWHAVKTSAAREEKKRARARKAIPRDAAAGS